jgi:dienelactone hydrolase
MLFLCLVAGLGGIRAVETLHIDQAGGFDVRVTYPEGAGPFPVIVWSHGLGGSKDSYQPLATYWADHGYIVIQPTHADSIQKRVADGKLTQSQASQAFSRQGMVSSMTNWDQRPKQISAVIDALPGLGQRIPDLKGKIDTTRLAVGGHSFGAHTSQLVAGTQLFGLVARGRSFEDKRPIAFIWISPQGPGAMLRSNSWEGIHRPVLMISGDNDSSPVDGRPASWRKQVWEGLAPGDKYLLWVKDAYHGFGGISGRIRFPGSGELNDGQVKDVQVTTTTYLNAYVKGDAAAKRSLQSGIGGFAAPAQLTSK